MPLLRASTLILLIAAAGAAPGADWKAKPFPEWSDETVLQLVTESPWARPKTVHFKWTRDDEQPFTYKDVPGTSPNSNEHIGGPIGGIGVPRATLPEKADIILRWASALPVRHAKALYQQRDEKLDPGKVGTLIAAPEEDYVLEVFGVPAVVAHKGTGSVQSLLSRTAYLRTKSGRILRPNRVDVSLQALSLKILIHFQRTQPLELNDGEIECYADFQVFEIREKFKLNSMVYLNHLEI